MQNIILNRKKIILVASLCVIIAGLFLWRYQKKPEMPALIGNADNTTATNSPSIAGRGADAEPTKVDITGFSDGSEATYSYVSSGNLPYTPPNLDTLFVLPDASKNVASTTIARVNALVEKLKAEPDNAERWLELGLYLNSWKDYRGATEAWKFSGALAPKDSRPILNLANMNGYYLKDFTLAESYYLEAIRREPKDPTIYLRAFEFYRDVAQNMAKAQSIIDQGLVANPNDTYLKTIREELSR